MVPAADHEVMTALFILIAILVVLGLSVPFGVDSRHAGNGYHRPNWL
jgi:hypothetical protein